MGKVIKNIHQEPSYYKYKNNNKIIKGRKNGCVFGIPGTRTIYIKLGSQFVGDKDWI